MNVEVRFGQLPDSVEIEDAPTIPGLRFRRYRGEDDIPAIVRVTNVLWRHEGEEDVDTVERRSNEMRHLVNCDPSRDIVMVELDGELVGHARVYWEDQTDGSRSYEETCTLDPRVWGRGIGRALLHWQEARVREIAAGHPGGLVRWYRAWSVEGNPAATRLLQSEGYGAVRYFNFMVRPTLDAIPDLPLPDGLEVRPVRDDQVRQVYDANLEAFRDHWGEIDLSEESYQSFVEDPRHNRDLWVVAWDGDEIAGIVMNVIDEALNTSLGVRRTYLDSVAVRQRWRRRGLARALMARALRLARDRGMTSASLHVDSHNANRALRLYEDLGFEVRRKDVAYRKRLELGAAPLEGTSSHDD